MTAATPPRPDRADLFARLALLTALGAAPFAVTPLYEGSTPDESQALFLRLFMALGVAAFGAVTLRRPLAQAPTGPLLVLAFVAWCGLSVLWAPHRGAALRDVTALLAGVAAYLLVTGNRLPLRRLAPPAFGLVAAVALFNAAVADLQFLATKGPLARSGLGETLSRTLGYGGGVLEGKANIRALFGHPNFLGGYLVPALAVLLGLVACGLRRRSVALIVVVALLPAALLLWRAEGDRSPVAALAGPRGLGLAALVAGSAILALLCLHVPRLRRLIVAASILGLLAGIVICRSRSAWLSAALAIVFAAAVLWHHRRLRLWHAALLLLLFAAAGAGLLRLRQERVETRSWQEVATLSTVTSRLYTFNVAAWMVRQQPLCGWGFGAFKTAYYQAVPAFQAESPDAELFEAHLIEAQGRPPYHVHNDYLEIAVETGLPGLALFAGLLAWTAVALARLLLARPATSHTWLALGVTAGLLAILADATLSFPLSLPLNALLFWTLLGLAHRLARDQRAGLA